MTRARFEGVFPYLVSPIDDSGAVKEAVLENLCVDLISAGVHGLTPLGSTGEFAYLPWEARRRIVEVTVAAAKGRIPVLAGVSATTISDAIFQAQEMERIGCDGIVAMLDSYFPVPDDGVFAYFSSIASAVGLPIVLYTNPNFQRTDLSLEIIQRLSHLQNIEYIKDASVNTGRLLSILNSVDGRIRVFAASSHIPACVMMIGGVGWMAGPACLAPRLSVRLYDFCRRGDWSGAMTLQRRLWRLNQAFSKFNLAACIKTGLTLQGYAVGDPLAPHARLNPAQIEELREVLNSLDDF